MHSANGGAVVGDGGHRRRSRKRNDRRRRRAQRRLFGKNRRHASRDAHAIQDALDAGRPLNDAQHFFPLRLIGHHAGQASHAVLEGHLNVIAVQFRALAQLAGDGVGSLLILRSGDRQCIAGMKIDARRFGRRRGGQGQRGMRDAHPQRCGK